MTDLTPIKDWSTDDQVEYIEGCIPRSDFEEVTSRYDTFTEQTVLELLDSGKESIQYQMSLGRDLWGYLAESKGEDPEDLFEEYTLGDMAYYYASMRDARIKTNIKEFNLVSNPDNRIEDLFEGNKSQDEIQELISDLGHSGIQNGFSDIGNEIWHEVGQSPELRIGRVEDDNWIFFEFWVKGSTDTIYDEREGRTYDIPNIKKISARLNIEDNYVTIQNRDSNENDINRVLSAIKALFNTDIDFDSYYFDITDDDVRDFEALGEFEIAPYAGHQGTADSTWSADRGVDSDTRYPDDRPHNFKNLVFDIPSVGRVSFRLSPEDNSFRIFLQQQSPEETRRVTEYIWQHLT